MYKWIVFDLAGVVVHMFFGGVEKAEIDGVVVSLEEVGKIYGSPLYKPYMRGKISEEALIKDFIEKSGIGLNFDQMRRIMKNYVFEIPGMIDLLKRLKGKYRLALATNEGKEWVKNKVAALHLDQVFEVIIESNKLHLLKPETEFFEKMLGLIDANPEEVLFIDDNWKNCESAEKLGIKSILFVDKVGLVSQLEDLGVTLS